jgi:hypothetical protein
MAVSLPFFGNSSELPAPLPTKQEIHDSATILKCTETGYTGSRGCWPAFPGQIWLMYKSNRRRQSTIYRAESSDTDTSALYNVAGIK